MCRIEGVPTQLRDANLRPCVHVLPLPGIGGDVPAYEPCLQPQTPAGSHEENGQVPTGSLSLLKGELRGEGGTKKARDVSELRMHGTGKSIEKIDDARTTLLKNCPREIRNRSRNRGRGGMEKNGSPMLGRGPDGTIGEDCQKRGSESTQRGAGMGLALTLHEDEALLRGTLKGRGDDLISIAIEGQHRLQRGWVNGHPKGLYRKILVGAGVHPEDMPAQTHRAVISIGCNMANPESHQTFCPFVVFFLVLAAEFDPDPLRDFAVSFLLLEGEA